MSEHIEIKLQKRTMPEMVKYIFGQINMMDISQRYKVKLFGMIDALEQRYDEDIYKKEEKTGRMTNKEWLLSLSCAECADEIKKQVLYFLNQQIPWMHFFIWLAKEHKEEDEYDDDEKI